MSSNPASLVLHVGYPKTATTTFQQHIFPLLPDLFYVGKFIPSFRYVEEGLYERVDDLMAKSTLEWEGPERLREVISRLRQQANGRTTLLSSESFVHPYAVDLGVVAERLAAVARPCRILITIREQISSILSWYWMHGRYSQYLTVGGKNEDDVLEYPQTFRTWLKLQHTAPAKNFIGTLHYDRVVAQYARVFGSENVRVLLFEDLRDNRDRYLSSLADWLGVEPTKLTELYSGQSENVSRGRAQSWQGRDADQLHALQDDKASKSDDDNAELSRDIEALRASFGRGNAILARKLQLPLKAYGYCVAEPCANETETVPWHAAVSACRCQGLGARATNEDGASAVRKMVEAKIAILPETGPSSPCPHAAMRQKATGLTQADVEDYVKALPQQPAYAAIDEVKTFSMVHKDVLMLLQLFASMATGPVLEIGPYVGGTSVAIAQGLGGAGAGAGPLISIELGGSYAHDMIPSKDIHADWRANMARFGVADRGILVEGSSADENTWRRVEEARAGRLISMLFVDADGRVERDFRLYGPLLAPNAIVVFDDYLIAPANRHKSSRVINGVDALVRSGDLVPLGVYGWGTWFGRLASGPADAISPSTTLRKRIQLKDYASSVVERLLGQRRM